MRGRNSITFPGAPLLETAGYSQASRHAGLSTVDAYNLRASWGQRFEAPQYLPANLVYVRPVLQVGTPLSEYLSLRASKHDRHASSGTVHINLADGGGPSG